MVSKRLEITDDGDLNRLRQELRSVAGNCDFTNYEATKLVTAASEVSRNILDYAGNGCVSIEANQTDGYVQTIFEDDGPGIDNVDRAMEDGYSGAESDGLGIGLPGAERLTDEFEVESSPESGTRVTLVVRKNQSL